MYCSTWLHERLNYGYGYGLLSCVLVTCEIHSRSQKRTMFIQLSPVDIPHATFEHENHPILYRTKQNINKNNPQKTPNSTKNTKRGELALRLHLHRRAPHRTARE